MKALTLLSNEEYDFLILVKCWHHLIDTLQSTLQENPPMLFSLKLKYHTLVPVIYKSQAVWLTRSFEKSSNSRQHRSGKLRGLCVCFRASEQISVRFSYQMKEWRNGCVDEPVKGPRTISSSIEKCKLRLRKSEQIVSDSAKGSSQVCRRRVTLSDWQLGLAAEKLCCVDDSIHTEGRRKYLHDTSLTNVLICTVWPTFCFPKSPN